MKKLFALVCCALVSGGAWFGWRHYDETHVSAKEAAEEIRAVVEAEPEFGKKLDGLEKNLKRLNAINSWVAAAKPATDCVRNFKKTEVVGINVWNKACQVRPELIVLDAGIESFSRIVDLSARMDEAATAFCIHRDSFRTHYAAMLDDPTWENVDAVITAAEGMQPVVANAREQVDRFASLTTRSRQQLTNIGKVINDPGVDEIPGAEKFAPPLRSGLGACLELVAKCDDEVCSIADGFAADDDGLVRIAGIIGDRTRTN